MTLGQDRYARALLANSNAWGAGPSGGNLLYAIEAAHNNGPWDNAEKFHRTNGVLRYTFGGEQTRSSITAMAYSASWNSTDQIPQRATGQGLIGRFGAIDPSDGGHTERYSLSFRPVQTLADGDFRLDAYAIRSKLDLFSNSPSSSSTRATSTRTRSPATSSSRPRSAGSSAWRRAVPGT